MQPASVSPKQQICIKHVYTLFAQCSAASNPETLDCHTKILASHNQIKMEPHWTLQLYKEFYRVTPPPRTTRLNFSTSFAFSNSNKPLYKKRHIFNPPFHHPHLERETQRERESHSYKHTTLETVYNEMSLSLTRLPNLRPLFFLKFVLFRA